MNWPGTYLPGRELQFYDSLLMPYSVYFGPGIRGDLNDTYRNIQEREGIITTLEPSNIPANLNEVRSGVLARNAKILGAFRKDMARTGLSQKMIEQHAGTIDTFAQTYLLAQEPPRGLLDTRIEDVKAYFHSVGNKINTVSFKRFVRFLAETGRMDYEQAEPLRDFLKYAGE